MKRPSSGGPYFELDQEHEDGVAHIRFCRPERLNTLTPTFLSVLRGAVENLDAVGRTRALVVSSTGRHFTAGMSLDVFDDDTQLSGVASARERLNFQRMLGDLMASLNALEAARFPVICAIQGGCIGGGLDLAAACDIRLCSSDAFFVVQETAVGMAADLGVLQRLPKIVAPGVVREMAYTADRLGADRALSVGLVNQVLVDHTALIERAIAMARRIAEHSPLAVAGTKAALNHARDHSVGDSLAHMQLLQSAIFSPDEMAAAISAWKNKQLARFEALAVGGDAPL